MMLRHNFEEKYASASDINGKSTVRLWDVKKNWPVSYVVHELPPLFQLFPRYIVVTSLCEEAPSDTSEFSEGVSDA